MSSECDYEHVVIKFDKHVHWLKDDLIALCALTGSNNLYRGSARVRKWEVAAIGTSSEVMSEVIRMAGSCEGQSLRLGNFGDSGCVTPETYIKRIRGLIKRAKDKRSKVLLTLAVRVFDHEVGRFDDRRRTLFSELDSSSVACERITGWSLTSNDSGEGKYDKLPAWQWVFSQNEVALFDKYRCLSQSKRSSSWATGPGEV